MDDAAKMGEVGDDGKEIIESFANVEGAGEVELGREVEHLLEKLDLLGTVEVVGVVVEADFADGDESVAALTGGEKVGALHEIGGEFGMDAKSPEDVGVGGRKIASGEGIGDVGADADNLADIVLVSIF